MPIDDPFALSSDQYLVIQTTAEDGLQQIQSIDGPQPYVDALFRLNDQFIDLINADDGYAFDADTARTELEQLGYGDDFEFQVGDKAVYPAQGVAEVVGIDQKEISGI